MARLAKNDLPKYREHASGQAIVYVGGRDYYLGKIGTPESWEKYHRLVAKWQADGRPTKPAEPIAPPKPETPITIIEVFALFKRFAKTHYVRNGKATGSADNFQATYRVFKARFGKQPATALGSKALKSVVEQLTSEGRTRRFISDRIHQLRRIYKWAAGEELIPFSAFQVLTTIEPPRRGATKAKECPPVLPVDDAIVEKTLPHLPPVVADMVRLQRLTGARPAEVCQLRPIDIDRTGDVWAYSPAEHKTAHHGKQRVVKFGPKAIEILTRYVVGDAEAFCFCPRESEKQRRAELHKARKTPTNQGDKPGSNRKHKPKRKPKDRYTSASYRRAIHRACEVAFEMPEALRLPRGKEAESETSEQKTTRQRAANKWRAVHCWSPNQLRHARATELRKTHGIEATRVALGHSRLNTTEIYAERDGELLNEIARLTG